MENKKYNEKVKKLYIYNFSKMHYNKINNIKIKVIL